MLDYLLELMRNEFSCERSSQFESLTLSERISLLSLGRRLKVFPLLYRYIKNIYPDDSLSDFDSLYYHQHVLANNQLEMLVNSQTSAQMKRCVLLHTKVSLCRG